ncbi:citramalate synthase [Streptomyces sp. ACA25]|uniref:citramalate synthase n=1 Tax=Streptomyces sp. ACA25 TaxID=3022596 RepID=UPI0023072281|nr:citramalate synthase [Streptomyces sp. ACA25]MDB1089564.1 citramalate synthase [Streptomyces sp. ACA25]
MAQTTARELQLYDTTLRDGMQQEGMVPTVDDKLVIARQLDAFGVGFIEAGWPGALPKDTEFFRRARTELALATAQLVAFGATRRAGGLVSTDPQVRALLMAETPVVTLVAKSDSRHVELALRTTLAENLRMISSTVRFLTRSGRRVFVDAEHYFDGFLRNREYALEVVRTAAEAGAEAVVLCDTNGGSLPDEIGPTVAETLLSTGTRLGIHCHNDSGCAVANTLAAVDAGADHVQGTAHGYGERCGNADLFTVTANLVLKRGLDVLPPGRLATMAGVGEAISAVTTVSGRPAAPYIGASAFTHKAGLHASALRVDPDLYQHTDPSGVGNAMRTLVSDMGGRSSVQLKAVELGYDLSAGSEPVGRAAARVKELESRGYSFESADASFELLLREELADGRLDPVIEVHSWFAGTGQGPEDSPRSEATVQLLADGEPVEARADAAEPVAALDRVLHTALDPHFPELRTLVLLKHRVRVLDSTGTARALLSFHDGRRQWGTVGVGTDTVAAAWAALLDACRYLVLSRRDTSDRAPVPAAVG